MPLFAAKQQLSYRRARLRLFDHLPQAAEQRFLWILPVLCILQQNFKLDKIYETNKTVEQWYKQTSLPKGNHLLGNFFTIAEELKSKTFLAFLIGSQGLRDPLRPGVIRLSPCFDPVKHGRKLLQIITIPEKYCADIDLRMWCVWSSKSINPSLKESNLGRDKFSLLTDLSPKTLIAVWAVAEICCMVETDQSIGAAGAGQRRQETGRLTLVTLSLIVR